MDTPPPRPAAVPHRPRATWGQRGPWLAVGLLAGALLTGCGGSGGASTASAAAGSTLADGQPTATAPSTPAATPPSAIAAGGLTASGGLSVDILGTFQCRRTGSGYTVQLTQGATQLSVAASSAGKISSAVYGTVGKTFGGPTVHGLRGTVTVKGSSATFTGVTLPSETGGPALVLNGTVPCG